MLFMWHAPFPCLFKLKNSVSLEKNLGVEGRVCEKIRVWWAQGRDIGKSKMGGGKKELRLPSSRKRIGPEQGSD